MTDRVKKMLDRFTNNQTFPLCVEKIALAPDALKKAKGRSSMVTRAHVLAAGLRELPIFIADDDLIAGEGASKPFGIEMDFEYGKWTKDEVEALIGENYTIEPDEEERLYAILDELEKLDNAQSIIEAEGMIIGNDDRLWRYVKSGLTLPPWKSKTRGSGGGYAQSGMGLGPGFYVTTCDFNRVLTEGARAMLNEAKECLANMRYFGQDFIENRDFWESVIMVYEAWIYWANRYADLAAEMAAKETNPKRKAELEQMSEACRRVPEYPARNFREAVQCFWFIFLLLVPSPTASLGRMDQYLYPFYKADKEAGRITDEEVLELLEIIRIKDIMLNRISGKANREKNAGMAKWHNCTIGGLKQDGSDATNELSFLIMQAALETQLPHHTVTLRVCDTTPIELLVKGLEVVKTGLGMPAFVGDRSYINFFTNHGISIEDARNYCCAGCVDASIPGVTRGQQGSYLVGPATLDVYMHRGYSKFSKEIVGPDCGDVTKMETFEEFLEGFYKQFDYQAAVSCEKLIISSAIYRDRMPDPFRSSLMRDGIKAGKDMCRRSFPCDNGSGNVCIGVVNTGDALIAIKQLVYEQKKYTMEQLLTALDANWEGYEEMRQDFAACPKYGNDIDEVDQLVAEIYDRFADQIEQYDTPYGGKVLPGGVSITAHQPAGKNTFATADGRFAGELLADGSMSPAQGRDLNGPLAIFKSALKINQDKFTGTLLNMKFHPTALKTDADLRKLASAIKTYLVNGGKHVQFNVTTREQLLAAKENPDAHRNLVVRVAGYSTYFTLLTPMIQEDVITRTTYMQI